MVYLVRHAHAGSQKRWSGRDHDRPLSARGQEQANGLLATLRDHPVARILTSPAVRCQHTVIPLSQQRGVPIELASSLAVQAPVEGLLELVADPSMRAAVLCGHGEQLRGLLRLLVGSVRFDGPLRLEKGSIWILDGGAGTVGAAFYVPPLRRKRHPDLHRLASAEASYLSSPPEVLSITVGEPG
jgi:phosphohistidine phosphatase SixA